MTDRTPLSGPHHAIAVDRARDRFAADLFDQLWFRYRERVSFVATYEQLVHGCGATFVNDHIAFRTFATQRPMAGIATLSRIFQALGYVAADNYAFVDKMLNAAYFRHPHPEFPKIFISELKVWELPPAGREIIQRVCANQREPIDAEQLSHLSRLDELPLSESERAALLEEVRAVFEKLPWQPPTRDDVVRLNESSQYGAWVLVHGYNVNHFTSLINSHDVDRLRDIERTAEELRQAGVPMKSEIEGERGSKLRQTATEAVMIDVDISAGDGSITTMPWTYAYFELAERGDVLHPTTNQPERFQGFLGPQATQLFEMTRVTRR